MVKGHPIMDSLVNEAATAGRVASFASMVAAGMIAVLFTIIGVMMMLAKPDHIAHPDAAGNPKMAGVFLIAIGWTVAGLAYLSYYQARSSRVLAAGQGVGALFNVL